MKKSHFAIVALLFVLTMGAPALAMDLGGLYVAPKLIWSYQMQDNVTHLNSGWSGDHGNGLGDKSDDAWGGALAVGYNFNPKFGLPVRAELEYAMRSQSRISGRAADTTVAGIAAGSTFDISRKLDISTLFVNLFYDFNTGTAFTPYVGGGVGTAFIHVKDSTLESTTVALGSGSKDASTFAWNLAAGVSYSLDANWGLDLGYRYCDFGHVKGATFSDTSGPRNQIRSHATAHEVMLGARYTF